MLIAERRRSWVERERDRPIHPVMRFTEDRLELGSGTILARIAGNGRMGRVLQIDGQETRILALLAAAYGRPVSPQILGNIRRAGREWAKGEACLAQIHLALTGLPKLQAPEDDAYRLFMADGLMEGGTPPRDILRALDLDPTPLDVFEKQYNPAEARIPAGYGVISGEWTAEKIASSLVAAALAPEDIAALGAYTADVVANSPKGRAFLGHIFLPSPAMPGPVESEIPGRSDLRYRWNADEGSLTLSQRVGNLWVPFKEAHEGSDGIYRDTTNRPVARQVGGNLIFDPATVETSPEPEKGPDTPGTPFVPFPLQSDTDDEPKLCPKPGRDRPGRKGDENPRYKKDLDYEDYVKAMVNPLNPTPRGFGAQLPNPERGGDLVYYDDCQRHTGWMFEYKGTGYAEPLGRKADFMRDRLTEEWLDQAERQIAASQGRPVIWVFAEEGARDYARKLFDRYPDLERIKTVWEPWSEASK